MRIVVPYTKEVLDSIIYEYQEFFYPFQFIFVFLSLWIIYSISKGEEKNSLIIAILAFFFFWIGAVYEIYYYNTINWIGSYVGSFFIFQSLLLLWLGIFKKQIVFEKNKILLILALILIVIYPLGQLSMGTNLYEISIAGMLPDITVLFSVLLFTMNSRKIKTIFIIPIVWLMFSLYWNYILLVN